MMGHTVNSGVHGCGFDCLTLSVPLVYHILMRTDSYGIERVNEDIHWQSFIFTKHSQNTLAQISWLTSLGEVCKPTMLGPFMLLIVVEDVGDVFIWDKTDTIALYN